MTEDGRHGDGNAIRSRYTGRTKPIVQIKKVLIRVYK